MTSAARIVETDRRRAILAVLSLAAGYSLPERALRVQVESVGYTVAMDVLRTDVAWLNKVGLMEGEKLTDRGLDVVLGRAVVPGVRRPEPGEM